MHLLDTEVVWELRGAKAGRSSPALARWAAGQPRTALFVSILTLAELGGWAGRLEDADPVGAAAVRRWAETQLAPAFEGRMLALDAAIGRRAIALGYADLRDGLLAATALEHGLTLATRTPAAFRAGKVRTFNPWGFTPEAAEEDLDWRQATRSGPQWLRSLFVRN